MDEIQDDPVQADVDDENKPELEQLAPMTDDGVEEEDVTRMAPTRDASCELDDEYTDSIMEITNKYHSDLQRKQGTKLITVAGEDGKELDVADHSWMTLGDCQPPPKDRFNEELPLDSLDPSLPLYVK